MSFLNRQISRFMKINEIYRQTLVSLFSKLLITAVGFFATIYFAHVVGPSILGVYFIFLACYGIFDLISDGGFGNAAIKRISEGSDKEAYFSAYIVLRIGLTSIAILLLYCAYQFLNYYTESAEIIPFLIIGLSVSLFASITFIGVYGLGKVGISQISGLIQTISQFAIQVLGIFLGFGFAGLAGGYIIGLAIQALMNYRFLTFHIVRFRWEHLTSLFNFSIWSFLSSSGALIYAYADTLLLAYFMSSADVGVYRTVFQFTTIASFITLAMQVVLFPKISSWNTQQNMEKIGQILARAIIVSLLLAVPICVGGWVLGDRLLYYLYGTPFVIGTYTLWILLVAQIINVFMLLFSTSLSAVNHPRDAFRMTMIASVVNIILNILFIPLLGINGAAIATCCAMALNAVLAYHTLSGIVIMPLEKQSLKNICFAAGCMGVSVLLFRFFFPLSTLFWTVAAVAFGAVIFIILILKMDSSIYSMVLNIIQEFRA